MRSHSICFNLEIRKIIFESLSLPCLVLSCDDQNSVDQPGLDNHICIVCRLFPQLWCSPWFLKLKDAEAGWNSDGQIFSIAKLQVREGIEDNSKIIFLISQ